jgi:hypothetical protein
MMILFVDEVAIWIMAAQGAVMSHQVPKYVTRARASLRLGIPEAELNRISKESGLGLVEHAGNQEETYFTYDELQRICMLAANQAQGICDSSANSYGGD